MPLEHPKGYNPKMSSKCHQDSFKEAQKHPEDKTLPGTPQCKKRRFEEGPRTSSPCIPKQVKVNRGAKKVDKKSESSSCGFPLNVNKSDKISIKTSMDCSIGPEKKGNNYYKDQANHSTPFQVVVLPPHLQMLWGKEHPEVPLEHPKNNTPERTSMFHKDSFKEAQQHPEDKTLQGTSQCKKRNFAEALNSSPPCNPKKRKVNIGAKAVDKKTTKSNREPLGKPKDVRDGCMSRKGQEKKDCNNKEEQSNQIQYKVLPSSFKLLCELDLPVDHQQHPEDKTLQGTSQCKKRTFEEALNSSSPCNPKKRKVNIGAKAVDKKSTKSNREPLGKPKDVRDGCMSRKGQEKKDYENKEKQSNQIQYKVLPSSFKLLCELDLPVDHQQHPEDKTLQGTSQCKKRTFEEAINSSSPCNPKKRKVKIGAKEVDKKSTKSKREPLGKPIKDVRDGCMSRKGQEKKDCENKEEQSNQIQYKVLPSSFKLLCELDLPVDHQQHPEDKTLQGTSQCHQGSLEEALQTSSPRKHERCDAVKDEQKLKGCIEMNEVDCHHEKRQPWWWFPPEELFYERDTELPEVKVNGGENGPSL